MMIEYVDPDERAIRLTQLIGIEDTVWVRVQGHDPIYAIADEDLERENEEKTSSVHFLRFELPEDSVRALQQGAVLSMGVDHSAYQVMIESIDVEVRESLVDDLAPVS